MEDIAPGITINLPASALQDGGPAGEAKLTFKTLDAPYIPASSRSQSLFRRQLWLTMAHSVGGGGLTVRVRVTGALEPPLLSVTRNATMIVPADA